MKHLPQLLMLAVIAFTSQRCADQPDTAPTKEKLQFSLSMNTNARAVSSALPTGTTVRLSIQRYNGESIYTLLPIDLLEVGGEYVTSPIELPEGKFKVTDFFLVNTSNEVIYATPKKGSKMAVLVQNPVNYIFTVQHGVSQNKPIEVVDVSHSIAADFGYSSFNVEVIHPLKVEVAVPSGATTKLTAATAYLLQGLDTLQNFDIAARTNYLAFKQSTNARYTFVIVKGGYARYSQSFVYDSLVASLGSAAWRINLLQAFTFLAYSDTTYSDPYEFFMTGEQGGSLHIDWGDGTSQSAVIESSPTTFATHRFPRTGNYFVSITGDLGKVTSFDSYYGHGAFDEINLERLPNLQSFIFGLSRSPKVIDLTHNTRIEFLNMAGEYNTEKILLPVRNKIGYIHIGGFNLITTAGLNDIITKVYDAAVADNRHDGNFYFPKAWSQSNNAMLKPPSPESLTKLRTLRDVYGWDVWPNVH